MTEQELVYMSVKGCRRIDLYTQPLKFSDEQKRTIEEIFRRRQNGEPLQYLLKTTQFCDCLIEVNPAVFVPRFETEILVEAALQYLRSVPHSPLICDLGTGSGSISISLAKNIKDCKIVALDCSEKALVVANKNALANQVDGKIDFIYSDGFSVFQKGQLGKVRFDAIISNPPYIPSGAISYLPVDVQKEPRLAFDGGEDGLRFYRMIADETVSYINEKGKLFLEFGDGQLDNIKQIFDQNRYFNIEKIVRDYTDTPRVMIAQEKFYG